MLYVLLSMFRNISVSQKKEVIEEIAVFLVS